MSSKARLLDVQFHVRYERFLPGWKALRATHAREGMPCRSFIELLDLNGLEAHVDDEGNIVDVTYGDDLNDYHLDDFLTALAPYVEDGSTLKFLSEYGSITKYSFRDHHITITCINDL